MLCLSFLFVCFCPNIFLASFLGTCPSLKGALGALLIINPIDLVGGHHSFQFDQTFGHTASNKRVYKHAAAEIVQAACDGGVGTIFMFGQTGSGKTHTMLLGRKRWVKFLAFWWPWHAWHQQFLQNKGANDSFSFFSTFFFAKTAAFSRVFLLLPNPPPPWNPGVLKSSFFSNQKKMVFFVHGAAGSRPQVCHWRDGDFRGFCSSGTIRRQWLGALGPVPTFRDFFFGTNSTHLKWVLGTFPPTKMGKMMQSWFFV